MSIPERREREKAGRREAILRCAKEIILSQGVERVRMEEIARMAELSKATVYLYFPSKDVLLNEICEEPARVFWEHLQPYLQTGAGGVDALRSFWRGYMELFSSSDEMIIALRVHKYLGSVFPVLLPNEQCKSQYTNTIIEAIQDIIDRCKAEGVFDPDLDSAMATRLLLSVFFSIMEKAANTPPEDRRSPLIFEEIAKAFQIIVRGFAREGVDLSSLDITG